MPESFFFPDYICCLVNKNNNNDDGSNDNNNNNDSTCKLHLALNRTVIFKVFCCKSLLFLKVVGCSVDVRMSLHVIKGKLNYGSDN